MHIDIKRGEQTEGIFKKKKWWTVTCLITLSEEEKLALKKYHDNTTLFTSTTHDGKPWPVPLKVFVNQKTPRTFESEAEATEFVLRLKDEILPKLKTALEGVNTTRAGDQSFEL